MPMVPRQTRTFDRSNFVAYAGAGAAIAFIAAMTIGAIDAPAERNGWVAEAPAAKATHMVSAAPSVGESSIR